MRVAVSLLFVLLNEAVSGGSADNEHVHFRIHVPEIVKQHVHTKTVYIHLHMPKKKYMPKKEETPKETPKESPKGSPKDIAKDIAKEVPRDIPNEIPKEISTEKEVPKIFHEEEHREDWSSWNIHDQRENHVDNNNGHEHSKGFANSERHKERFNKYFPGNLQERPQFSPSDSQEFESYRDSTDQRYNPGGYLYPSNDKFRNVETNDVEPSVYDYEKGYRKGSHTQSGHLHSDQTLKFHDDKYEEQGLSDEELVNVSREKTDAGRYFVDETDYENNNNNQYEKSKSIPRRNFVM